ncbi:hypothetical protein B0H13DRAFT_2354531 [Mycena leptocephala]|nr:hypothetical protein B0H13DRAFT_2354531 [Mycena leptocephala]
MHDGDHGAVVRSAVAGAYLRALPHLAPCPPSFPPCPFLSLPSTSWPRPGAPFLPSALLPSLPPSFPSPLPLSSPKTKQNSPHTSVQAFNAQFTLGGKDEAQFRPPQGASSTCARAADATGTGNGNWIHCGAYVSGDGRDMFCLNRHPLGLWPGLAPLPHNQPRVANSALREFAKREGWVITPSCSGAFVPGGSRYASSSSSNPVPSP